MPFPIFSLLATAGNAIANGLSARRANRINQKNYEEVRRYNRPEMQMGRFRSAGLNPHLIYTQQNTAEQRPEWRPPQFDLSSLANAPSELATYQNINESKSRVGNLVAQNKKLEQEIAYQAILNRYADQKEKLSVEQITETINQIRSSTNKIVQDIANSIEELNLKKGEFWKDYYQRIFDNTMRSKEFELQLKRLGLDWYKAQIELTWEKKLNELVSNIPDLSNINFSSLAESIKGTYLETIIDFLNDPTGQSKQHKSTSGRTFGGGRSSLGNF